MSLSYFLKKKKNTMQLNRTILIKIELNLLIKINFPTTCKMIGNLTTYSKLF